MKFYDKKAEQLANYNQDIDGELSRVEITYKSYYSERLIMRELLARPPDFSNIYKCFIIDDIESIPNQSDQGFLLFSKEKSLCRTIILQSLEADTYQISAKVGEISFES